ncbi:MAG: hypothetical protein ACPG5D_07585, partial [Schleiferiaceae bacterium]
EVDCVRKIPYCLNFSIPKGNNLKSLLRPHETATNDPFICIDSDLLNGQWTSGFSASWGG